MSRDRGRRDRPALEDLVQRARIELRDWTDADQHDPGVALLELFAYVGDLLSSYSEQIGSEAYLGSERRRYGVHRATVVDNADPLGRSRLFVRVPDVSGDESVWAAACLPASAPVVPAIGADVWVAFEAGDASRPVWLGEGVSA
ncbi:phage baseplate assembly protein V [Phycicoccus sp. Soil803]|uniref:phage baseplate assembly protein V n=1 Tax=Phycicoccus sp. Soil803 TaxID=1736415 RepID=UPI00070FC664|nr:phage baseplate assembly protein V [Phycicoccus sp. Soil803]KRF24744.1 hypothetical protein ASG95_09670 [Phycicoccus sp. Soil803]